MKWPAYKPPCRLIVKREAIVQGHPIPVGEYRVWWGLNWIIEPVTDDHVHEMYYTRVLERPQ